MAEPTTSILFSGSTPAAPTGDQVATPQTDSGSPFQNVDFIPKRATSSLYGTVLLPAGGMVSAAEIQEESFIYAEDTGSANAYAIALSPAPSIGEGSVAVVKIANANTGASTLAVNGGSATAIKKDGSAALASGDLSVGQIAVFVYDGADWQLTDASGGGSSPLTLTTAGTSGPATLSAGVLNIPEYSSGVGASIYFGNANASAAAGDNTITLGSTPLAGSVSIFVAGSLVLPYSVSGATIKLSSALTSGQVVVATWATANATPGTITLSEGTPPPLDAWPMNEGTGSTLFDQNSSTGTNLTLSGGTPTWGAHTGFPGSTLYFPTSGIATAGSAAPTNFSGSTPFTVGLWVMITAAATGVDVWFDTSDALASAGLYIRQGGSGDFLFEVVFGGPYPTNAAFVQATGPVGTLAANTLYYLVITYDGSLTAAGIKMYINGAAQATSIVTNNLAATVSTTNPLKVQMPNGNGGTVAFVETWNVELTPAQIASNYALGPGIY